MNWQIDTEGYRKSIHNFGYGFQWFGGETITQYFSFVAVVLWPFWHSIKYGRNKLTNRIRRVQKKYTQFRLWLGITAEWHSLKIVMVVCWYLRIDMQLIKMMAYSNLVFYLWHLMYIITGKVLMKKILFFIYGHQKCLAFANAKKYHVKH